jgi:hypothetical protein
VVEFVLFDTSVAVGRVRDEVAPSQRSRSWHIFDRLLYSRKTVREWHDVFVRDSVSLVERKILH